MSDNGIKFYVESDGIKYGVVDITEDGKFCLVNLVGDGRFCYKNVSDCKFIGKFVLRGTD